MIDESTDNRMQQHLITYVVYVSDEGKGDIVTNFVTLIPLKDVLINLLKRRFLREVSQKLLALKSVKVEPNESTPTNKNEKVMQGSSFHFIFPPPSYL